MGIKYGGGLFPKMRLKKDVCARISWAIKKAECQIIDVFKLWCWRRLKSPLDSKEIKPVNA